MGHYNYIRNNILEMINESSDEIVLKNKELILDYIFAEEETDYQDACFYEMDIDKDDNVAQLYAFKHHVKINESVVEFMKLIFKHPEIIFNLYKLSSGEDIGIEDMVSLVPDMVLYFKNYSKNFLVKLDDISLCVYLQAVKNWGQMLDFSKEDIINWFPKDHQCELKPTKWECKYFKEGKCTYESDGLSDTFEHLLEKGVFKSRDDKFIINF